jgi:hypothetical protein
LDYDSEISVGIANAIEISIRNIGMTAERAVATLSCKSNNNPGTSWSSQGLYWAFLQPNQLGSITIPIPPNVLLPNDVYSCEIKVYSETGLVDDSRSVFISTLGLEQSSTPVPETSALFLPFVIAIVLGLLASSKKRKNQ